MFAVDPPLATPAQFATPAVVTRAAAAHSGPPAVAIDAGGRTLVAWTGNGARVFVRRGTAGPARAVSARRADSPAVALGPDGSAAVIFERDLDRGRRLLEVSVAPPGGAFGRPQRLVSVVASVTSWQVLAAGPRFVAVWWQGVPGRDHAVRYALSDGARFGAAQTLAKVDGDGASSAAADAAGNVIVGWNTPIEDQTYLNRQAAAALLPAGATRFGAAQVVSADTAGSGSLASRPQAAPGAVGYFVGAVQPWLVQVARVGADGRFGAPATAGRVDANERGTSGLGGPVIALPVAAWAVTRLRNPESEETVAGRVEAAFVQPDGSFSAAQRLTGAGEFPDGPLAATATSTTAIVVWPDQRERLRYSLHTATAGFTPARTLASGTAGEASVAAAGEHAAAAWLAGRTVRLARLR